MKQRAITAVFFAIAMIGGVYGGLLPFRILSFLIAAGSLWELLGLLLPEEEEKPLRRVVGLIWGLAPFMAALTLDREYLVLSAVFPAFVFLLLLFELFGKSSSPFSNMGTYLLGLFYITMPILLLQYLANKTGYGYAPNRVFGLLWLVWTNDTLAYLIGSKVGRTKLFQRISPNKTWEGTLGGVVCTIGMAWLLSQYFDDYTTPQWLTLGAVVGVFGTLGDLVESMLKRSIGVKDSGNLLPGHGGLLDRFDAFLFVIPFAWLAMAILEQ